MATATLAPPQSEEDHDQAAAPASGPGACIAGTSAAAPSTAVKGRRKVFDAHLDQDTIEAGLATGALIRGILRVSGSKLSIAFVRPEGARSDDRDLVVRGSQHRNRAVHGDVVIVQPILYGRQEESSSEEEAPPPAAIPCSDSEEEEIVLNKPHLAGAARAAPKSSEQEVQMAKVVAIAEKKGQGRVIVCTLHPDRDKKDSTGEVLKDDRFIRAVPTDKRLPTMLLQINNVTTKALRLPGKLDRFQLWPMQIQVWNESSKHPLCRLQGSCLGRAGSLEAEERHALIANELDSHDVDFCEEELDEVDQIVQAAQRDFESEAASRMDLRQKRIFTIDPATAKDLDDAIHVEDLKGKGQIEVGVHIADVAHFLKLGTITDEEARRRTTSVYLIGRVLPMLPHGLCNYLCSLNPNEPKLAFSAFFRLCKRTGQLIENPAPWFAKTAISSVCRLNYEQAQDIIDDLDIEEEDRPLVHGGYTWQQIKDDILLLYEVCGKVRHGRLTGGAMTISKTKMVFHTRDSEDGIPTGYHLESHSASHWVIEELMLLANRCVAKRLAMSELSEVAVLRNHKPPDLKKAETLQKLMRERLGIKDFSMSSAFAIYKSCQDIYQKHGKMLGLCVEMMIMRAGMKQAEYFLYGVVEEEEEEHCPHHFALNFDYYTHFTSPIRRYPDVMVHRVLCALLDRQMEPRGPAEEGEEEGPAFFQTRDEAKEQVKICNEKKMNSRRCQEQLDRAVFCIYLRSMKSWCYTVGTILAMTRNERDGDSLTVYCSQLGRESKVTLCRASAEEDNVELFRNGVDDELLLPDNWEWLGRGAIQITWRSREDKEEVQKLQTLSCIPIVIIPTNTVPIDYALFVVSPFHKKYSEVKADIKESEFDGFTWTEEDEEGVDVVYDEGAPVDGGE